MSKLGEGLAQADRKLEHEAKAAAANDGPDRPTITIDPGDLPAMLDAAEQALLGAAEPIYVRDGALVAVTAGEGRDNGIARDLAAPQVRAVEAPYLRERLTACADWMRFDARSKDYRLVDAPRSVAEGLMARPTSRLRSLVAIIDCPTLRPNGSVLDQPGHDPETGLLLTDVPAGYSPPPDHPTQADAIEGAQELSDALGSLPWADPAAESAGLAAVLTAVLRRSLPSAPIIAIDAPTPGTGKTLLAESIAMLTSGRRPPVMALGDDPAELEKRLGALLLAGDPLGLLDNIERAIKSELLCQMATQPVIQIRVLGATRRALLTTRCTLILTGNNLTIRGDLNRRTLRIPLDAHTERPEQRTHDRDLLADLRRDRGRLLRAALMIPRAYLAAGEPAVDIPPYGGFADWDRMVRRPLAWIGLPDPLQPAGSLRDDDPDLDALRAVLTAWTTSIGDQYVTAGEVVETAGDHQARDLREALHQAVRDPTSRSLGYWLRAHAGRPCDGQVLVRGARVSGVVRWGVKSTTD